MNKIQKLFASFSLAIFFALITVVPVHADTLQCGVLGNVGGVNWCEAKDFNTIIGYIVTMLVGIIGIVLAIVILVSAIQFITSGGSPDRIKSAKERLVQAAVSLGFLISFNAIFNIVSNNLFANVNTSSFEGITTLGNNVIAILLSAVGVLSVIFIIIGGIQYSTSAGDPNKVSTAKATITYAIIGLAMSLSIGAVITLLNTIAK